MRIVDAGFVSSQSRRKFGLRGSIGAGIGTAEVDPGTRIMHNGVPAPHQARIFFVYIQNMSHAGQFVPYLRADTRLNVYMAASLGVNRKAWGFERLLDVHPVVRNVRDELRVREWLICPTHDAEADVLVSSLHKRRNDGVKRTLMRRDYVRRVRIKRKQCTSVLQHESHAAHRDA